MNANISQLIDELGSEDGKKRLNSMKNLTTISAALGPEKTRTELLPFIEELNAEFDDETICELVEILGKFIDYIGGSQYFEKILRLLEVFCRSQENIIRLKAINSVKKILSGIDIKGNEEIIIGFIKRCYASEYHCSKEAVAVIIPFVYKQVSAGNQTSLLNMFIALTNNDIPVIRKFASMNLQALLKMISNNCEKEIIDIFNSLVKDNQDLVRIYIVEALLTLFIYLPANKHSQNAYQYVKILAEDSSWRVRYNVCDKISDLCENMGKEPAKQILIPYYLKYLQDPEGELRASAACQLHKVCKILDAETIAQKIAPFFKSLLYDPQIYVKSSLADSLLLCCPYLGKKGTIDYVLPAFTYLLKDQDSDVRINLFKNLGEITKVLGIDSLLTSIVQAFQEISMDKNWRTRKIAVEYFPIFAKQIGIAFFNEKTHKILISAFNDKVFSVREAAAISLKSIIEILGSNWFEQNILGNVIKFATVQNYLYRQILLYIFINIVNIVSANLVNTTILPLLLDLSKDPVANIRINCCKCLRICFKVVPTNEKEKIKKAFTALNNDNDYEVKITAKNNSDAL